MVYLGMPHPRLEIKNHLKENEVKKRYLSCQNGVEKIHWQVIWLLAKKDNPLSTEEVSKVIGYSSDWVRKLARRYNEEGPDGIEDKRKHNGTEFLLDEKEKRTLEKKLSSSPIDGGLWNGRKVSLLIQEIIGRKVSLVTGWKYLKSLGYSLQVPRPMHTNSATEQEQATFKKNSKNTSKISKQNSPKSK
jgi:transposase